MVKCPSALGSEWMVLINKNNPCTGLFLLHLKTYYIYKSFFEYYNIDVRFQKESEINVYTYENEVFICH